MAASQGNPLLDGLLDMKAAKIGASAPMAQNYRTKSSA
jgi:hypothetical protein